MKTSGLAEPNGSDNRRRRVHSEEELPTSKEPVFSWRAQHVPGEKRPAWKVRRATCEHAFGEDRGEPAPPNMRRAGRWPAGASGVIVAAELSLDEPDVDHGLVTWFDVRVVTGDGAESVVIGEARVARIHVGARW